MRGAFTTPPAQTPPAADHSFDTGEVVIVAVAGGPHRQDQRSIRFVRVLEPTDQRLELRPRIIGRIIG